MKWKDITAIAGLQYSGMAINFFLQLFLTFQLAPEVFGVYAKLVAIREIFGAVLSGNIAMAFIYVKEKDQQKLLSTSFYLALGQATVYLTGILLFFPFSISLGIFSEEEFKIFAIIIAGLTLNSIYIVLYTFFEKEERFKFNSIIVIIVQAVIALVTIIISFITKDITALIIRDTLPAFILLAIYTILTLKEWGKGFMKLSAFSRDIASDMIKYSFKMYFSRTIESIFFRLDILFASAYFNTELVGIYERIKYFATLPQTLITTIISRINLVKYSKNNDIINVQRTNYVALVINIILFPIIYFVLYFLDEAFARGIQNYLFPMYLFFFAYAGLGSILENIKTYFYATDQVLKSGLVLRLIPVIFFTFCWFLFNKYLSENISYNAFVLSIAYVLPLIFINKKFYKVRIKF